MITILIPLYNGIEFIEECISGIKSQTYHNWEVIIGVNGYDQNSKVYQKACSFVNDKIKVLDLYNIKGKPKTLNEMVKHATYNWIALLDIDDVWLSNKLKDQLQYTDKYDVIGTRCMYFGELNNIVPSIPIGDITSFNFLSVNPMINSSVILKKELCQWREDTMLEDYELWLRLWKMGNKFYNHAGVHVLHRIHKESAFNSKGNHDHVKDLILEYSVVPL
jgi:glycosyltransferase involved in cell wall biosynthesis